MADHIEGPNFPTVHEDAGFITQMIECDYCGEVFCAVHAVCEWLQCVCDEWVQVDPVDDEFMYIDEKSLILVNKKKFQDSWLVNIIRSQHADE